MWAGENVIQNTEGQINTDSNKCELIDFSFVPGNAQPDEKPSDFAGIWKNRKKIDAKKLRQRAWAK